MNMTIDKMNPAILDRLSGMPNKLTAVIFVLLNQDKNPKIEA